MKLKFSYSKFLLIIGLFVFIRCTPPETQKYGKDPNGGGGDGTPNNSRFDEKYIIPNGTSGALSVEYSKYHFKKNEKRDIIIRGQYIQGVSEYIWFDNPDNGNVENAPIGKGPNATINEDDNYFVCPITIKTDGNFNGWDDVKFYVGNKPGVSTYDSDEIDFIKTENRDFTVRYSYEENFHLFQASSDFNQKQMIVDCFKTANTSLNFVTDKVLTEYMTWFFDDQEDQTRQLWNWCLASIRPGINAKKYVGLIGASDFESDEVSAFQVGLTLNGIPYDNNTKFDVFSIVWKSRIFSNYPTEEQGIALVATHELGHARGELLTTNEEGYVKYLTIGDHESGHNGKHKEYCVIRYADNMSSDARGEHYKKPQFCEGHKQMLYNITWLEGEQ